MSNEFLLEAKSFTTDQVIEELDKLPNILDKTEWATKHLVKLGAGGTRNVFALNDREVLKLVKGKQARNQNESEVELFQCTGPEFFAEITSWDKKDFDWLVMERVEVGDALEVSIKNIFKSYGVWDFTNALLPGGSDDYDLKQNVKSEHRPWLEGFLKVVEHCRAPTSDMIEDNLGVRTSTGLPVIIDYADRDLFESSQLKLAEFLF